MTVRNAEPAEVARKMAIDRGQRKLFDAPTVAVRKVGSITDCRASKTPDKNEDFVRSQADAYDERRESAADRLWGAASR